MDNGSTFQGQSSYIGKTSNRKRLVTIFLVIFLLIIAGLGALYLLGTAKHSATPTNPVPTASVSTPTLVSSTSASLSPSPTATPSAALDKSTLNVSVLNGSGTPGAADKMASSLKSAGYTNITTGNANVFTYTGITLHVKKQGYLKELQKDIATIEPNAKVTSGLDSSLTTDVEIIVGK